MRRNLPKLILTAFLLIAVSFSTIAQKEKNPIENFKSPFKAKKDTTKTPDYKSSKVDVTTNMDKTDLYNVARNKNSLDIKFTEKYNITADNFFRSSKNIFHFSDSDKYELKKSEKDKIGFTHHKYQQYYKGIPVIGGEYLLHEKNGKMISSNGNFYKDLIINPIPNISKQIAIQNAIKFIGAKKYQWEIQEEEAFLKKETNNINATYFPKAVLAIAAKNGVYETENFRLCYQVNINSFEPYQIYDVYIDAQTGEFVNKVSKINDGDVAGTASTLYSGTKTITNDSYAGSYRLRESGRPIQTFNMKNGTNYSNAIDFTNTNTTWNSQEIILNSITISTVNNNWEDILGEQISNGGAPDIYIEIRDASNNVVWTKANAYYENTFPPITINTGKIVLTSGTYTLNIYDYDVTSSDDLLGSFTFTSTAGNVSFSANGTSGSISRSARNNPALDVHWGMEKVYDFYLSQLGRNSFDNAGGIIKNYVHKDIAWNNANWNGTAMSYGDGDNSLFSPLTSIDVVGHEFTHAVVQYTAGLVYQGESGALNESFADIFGTAIEFYGSTSPNWSMGENIVLQSPFLLRSMSNPNGGLAPQPDTYQSPLQNGYWINPNSTQDYGGVHTNSGVQNFWFYLLCQGGTGTNDFGNPYSVTGIGINQATQIAYRNLTTYLGSNATYYQSYLGSLQAAEDLYGNPSAQYTAVKKAWYAVGIGNDPNNFCSGTTNLTATSGSFTDGSGSSNYNNNQNCKWVIAPVGANQITLNFTSFATEANYDTVFVYNGPNESYPVLMTWWGNALPPTVSTSAGTGAMCIKFKTDNTNTAAGWAANYTSTGITPGCNGGNVLAAPTGTFTDGSGTSNYGNNQLCYWLIAPPCATSVTLSLTQLNTEAGYDGLIVYNGSSTSSPILGSFSGTTLPSSVTANSGQMLVVFTSDFSTNAQGFSANYTSTGSAYCSGTTTLNTADYGTITDGSGASNYCNNQNCSWLIQPPQATSVTLNFSAFDVEAASTDGNSIYDAVEIYNGTTTAAPLLGRFSGNTIPPAITASSGSMLVRFFSDVSVTKAGWSAYYTSTSPAYCNSTTTLTSANGTFTDGSGTSQYANNSNCSWLIQPTNAGNITLSFTEFNTELNYDGVIVYNGANASAPVLGQFSGTTIPSPVIATGGSMFVRFLSDEALRSGGWTANYTSTTLPLNLLEFNASHVGNEVSLKWITTSEVNTKEFIVARSIDGNTWTDLGSVTALNTSGTNNYSFNDLQPIQGISYYRLKMVDKDGKFTYSPIRAINITKNNLPFVIAPNPASSFTTIYFNRLVKAAEVSVIDAQGRKLFTDIIKNAGITTYHLKTDNLVSGVYIIHVQTSLGNFTERLLINK